MSSIQERAHNFLSVLRHCQHLGLTIEQADEQGLVILQRPRAGWIVTLTSRGSDVAEGLANVPGVAKPRPGA